MKDIQSPRLMWLKGGLFLFVGILSAALVVIEAPTVKVALLLALAIWGFCRAYYFAFYVIERYVDPRYRFSGLFSFVRHVLKKNRDDGSTPI